MYRIKNPRISLAFYIDILGMSLLYVLRPDPKITLFFLGYENPDDIPVNEEERFMWALTRQGVIQLQ